ncbi:LysR substrate-binding domain-containing protein [Streptomyces roseifaciens]
MSTVAAVDLADVLGRFRADYPEVRISLRMGMSEELIDGVREGTRPKGVRVRKMAHGELVAVVAPEHPLAGRKRTDLQRLSEESFVDFPAGSAARRRRDAAFEAAGLTAESPFEITSVESLAELVRVNLGVGMVPEAVAGELRGLHVLRVRNAPTREALLVRNTLGPSPAAAAFLSGLGIDPGEHSS